MNEENGDTENGIDEGEDATKDGIVDDAIRHGVLMDILQLAVVSPLMSKISNYCCLL
jgi:hypothetical protein